MFTFTIERLKPLLNKRSFRNDVVSYRALRLLSVSVIATLSLLFGALLLNAQNLERLFVSSFGSNQVLEYDGSTGSFIEVFVQGDTQRVKYPEFSRLRPGR